MKERVPVIIKQTKATSFLLPMLGLSTSYYGTNLINVYIGDKEKPEFDNKILLLFRLSNDHFFEDIEAEITHMSEFIASYDVEPNKIMFVFDVIDEYREDYKLFLEGSYSKFSDILKKETLRLNRLGPNSNVWGAFNRSEKIKKLQEERIGEELPKNAEVISKPELEEEIFRYN